MLAGKVGVVLMGGVLAGKAAGTLAEETGIGSDIIEPKMLIDTEDMATKVYCEM